MFVQAICSNVAGSSKKSGFAMILASDSFLGREPIQVNRQLLMLLSLHFFSSCLVLINELSIVTDSSGTGLESVPWLELPVQIPLK